MATDDHLALSLPGQSGLPETTKPQRLIRLAEVKQRVGLSRASIYKRMSEGRFPKSRSLGSRCAVWIESEINDWIENIAAG